MPFPLPRHHEPRAGTFLAAAPISRRRALLLLGTLLLSASSAQARHFLFHDYGPSPKLTPPDRIVAVAALLIDAQTGQVLYARNPNQRLLPASTTKLMTALLVREHLGARGLTGEVRVEEQDRAEPSNIPVVPGETISIFNLFHALLIESANDSARTLGRWASPNDTVDGFVDMMNEKAVAMGLFNTHFHNPNGLPAPAGTHYTSCADLMKIFQAVLRYPELRQICSTLDFSFRSASGFHHMHNHNRLLAYYPGMGAAKTGWTVASKHTYAASCRRGGRELLLTLLDSQDKWSDAMILFNWGFAQAGSAASENSSADLESTGGPALSSVPNVPALAPAPAGRADGR